MNPSTLKEMALAYHAKSPSGKLAIQITKPTDTQNDLKLAYTPGVAEPVKAIAENPEDAYLYTAKGNLVAVISNGTAVLGLGNMGALASKPVMEGKAVLFKRFADVDVFDIEVDANNPSDFIDTVTRISPTFGGINLEDLRAPECFEIERALQKKLTIPVFHDDQHGTAIIVCAGLLNALEVQNKVLGDVKIVCAGAGAAGIASMKLLMAMGARKESIFMVDSRGVIRDSRSDLNHYKAEFSQNTTDETLADVMRGADVFVGVAQADLLTADMLNTMSDKPIVFALSNPDPEIRPELAEKTRSDVLIATGRSDYPNQINNVLCFPYLFRGALDVRANCINQAMQLAAVRALRDLAHEPIPDAVKKVYPDSEQLRFGRHYIIPKPLDPRLRQIVSHAVAKAAIESQVARKVPQR